MRKVFLEYSYFNGNIAIVRDFLTSNYFLCNLSDLLLADYDDDKTYFLPNLKIKNEFKYWENAFENLVYLVREVS